MEESAWYAFHVRPRFEQTVAFYLEQHEIEYYLPWRRVTRPDTIKRSILLPLFPGFVFCKTHAPAHRSFLTIPGILDVVGVRQMNMIPEEKITDLKRIVEAGLVIQPWAFMPNGKSVRVEAGPLKGIKGVLCASDPQVLVFSIWLIGRAVGVQVDNDFRFSSDAGVGTAA
jgi:transcription antitermination factor NusG